MYVSLFWCGVAATIGVEIALSISVLIYFGTKEKKK